MLNLCTLLGIKLPILQAPMAGVQGSTLAIAVSTAGGLGALPGALLSLDALRSELRLIRAATNQPYNVNFFCHTAPSPDSAKDAAWRQALAPYYDEFGLDTATAATAGAGRAPFSDAIADVLEEFRPPVVSFHFGLPSEDLLARVRRWGSRVISSATTHDEARWLEARGVDAIIAQGLSAGGHRGHFLSDDLTLQSDTLPLLVDLLATVSCPVIASGGIHDARTVAAAIAAGAAGVQVGTAFLLCPEATTSAVHRKALATAAALDGETALTNVFTGRPARGLINRAMRELGPMSAIAPGFPSASSAILPLRAKSESLGSGDFSPLWSGTEFRGCRAIPAMTLLRELAAGL